MTTSQVLSACSTEVSVRRTTPPEVDAGNECTVARPDAKGCLESPPVALPADASASDDAGTSSDAASDVTEPDAEGGAP